MRAADKPVWRKRSLEVNPVEGASEIDITLEGRRYVVFVEAKLSSDVSLATTYDPARNQIARNIDCVLEVCRQRRPTFWMFVRDRQPTRAYMQLMARYRSPSELHLSLPHRAMTRLGDVVAGLAVVTWSELLALLDGTKPSGFEPGVERELRRRVSVL